MVNYLDLSHQLVVRRYNGTLLDVSVRYRTIELAGVTNEYGVSMTPAVENRDFQRKDGILQFGKGRVSGVILIHWLPRDCISDGALKTPSAYNG